VLKYVKIKQEKLKRKTTEMSAKRKI